MADVVVDVSKLEKIMREAPGMAEKVVSKLALDAEGRIKSAAPVDTGNLKNRIAARKIRDGEWVVEDNTSYGKYPEYGTRRMPARPFFRPGVRQTIEAAPQEMRVAFRELVE